jgi:hypothetical protein
MTKISTSRHDNEEKRDGGATSLQQRIQTPFISRSAASAKISEDLLTSILDNIAQYFGDLLQTSARSSDPFFDETYEQETTQETIIEYLSSVVHDTQLEFECLICAVIYLDRLLDLSASEITKLRLQLSPRNWRNLFAVCAMISAKVWDDFSMSNNDFRLVFPDEDLQQVNRFEVQVLQLLGFNVSITGSTYESYLSRHLVIDESAEDEIDSLMCDSFAEQQSVILSTNPPSHSSAIVPSSLSPPPPPQTKDQQFLLSSTEASSSSSPSSSSSARPSQGLLTSLQQQFFHYLIQSNQQKSKISKVYCC